MERVRNAVLAAVVAVLSGCGGGGGGSSPDLGPVGGGGIQVTPGALTFSYEVGGAAPPMQALTVTWTATGVAAAAIALPPGTTQPSWFRTPPGRLTGPTTATFDLAVNTAGMSPGTQTLTLLVGIANGDGVVVGHREVVVTFLVRSFNVTPASIEEAFVRGAPLPQDNKRLALAAATATAWTATADRSWITLGAQSGTTPSTLAVRFAPAGLAPGTHTGTITVRGAGGEARIPVTATVSNPDLRAAPAAISLAGLAGHAVAPATVGVTLATMAIPHPWSVTTTDAWLELVQTVATVASEGASFTVRPAAGTTSWPVGTYVGTVTVSASIDAIPVTTTVPVTFVVDEARLVVSDDGVALTDTPSLSRLTRTVTVGADRALPAGWTATADQGWLDVTGSGTVGDALVLAADPSALATDALHEATVTISSSDPALAHGSATVKVGLWVGATTPDPTTVVTAAAYTAVVLDPVRPYAYLSNGSAAIAVVNVYTGASVAPVQVPGASLTQLAVASDGAHLYAVDAAVSPRRVVPVDLASRTPGAAWSFPRPVTRPGIAFARVKGIPLLLSTAGIALAPGTGSTRATFLESYGGNGAIAASRSGDRFCWLDTEIAPAQQLCWRLDATTRAGVSSIAVVSGKSGPTSGTGRDVALSPDGARVYVAADVPDDFMVLDATGAGNLVSLPVLPGAADPRALDVAFDGRVVCGSSASSTSAWIYDDAGAALGSFAAGAVAPGGVAWTGDALRVVVVSSRGVEVITAP